MSYDRIWIQCSKHPRDFHERSEPEDQGLLEEFDANFNRLYDRGHFVVLVAGKNCLDEIFLFENASDAKAFYDGGFRSSEPFLGDENPGGSFESISLYQAGEQVASKSCAPTTRIEAKNE